jgi:CubicO group peptidase (beta-lactamase class C family)
MKRFVSLILGVLFLIPAFAQSRKTLPVQVDHIVQPYLQTNNFSGTVLISQHGKIIFSKAYGKMSREYGVPNHTNTKFMLASVSMIFTSAAIMKLQEAGKLSVNDSLSKYFPDYKYANRLTLHDLLAQRSGIPAIGTGGNVTYDSMTKFHHSPQQLYAYFKDYDLLFQPGEKYNHGRSDYILLALIIEKVSGKGFRQYLKEEIFMPLGMVNTGHYSSEKEIIPFLAKGYAPKDLYDLESAYGVDWSSRTGHASIYSTTTDLHLFLQAALKGNFLNKNSWGQLFKDYGNNVGYGWFVAQHLNRDRIQMNGLSPGYSSFAGFYPKEGLSIVVLSNTYVALAPEIAKAIAAAVLNEPFQPLNLTDKKVPEEFAKKIVGTYRFDKNFYRPNYELTISYEYGRLHSDWGGLIPIDKEGKDFKEYILRRYWSSITFLTDGEGTIKQMRFDDHTGEKVR